MADETSIQYLNDAAVQTAASFVDTVYNAEFGTPVLQGSALNSEHGDIKDDYRRILEVNESTGQGQAKSSGVTNKQVLPFLVCALGALSTDTLPVTAPAGRKYTYISDDSAQYGVFRLIDYALLGRVYVTTYGQALDIWNCLKLREQTTFLGSYTIPWLPTDPADPPKVQVRLGAPAIAKYSGLETAGQLFGVEFSAHIRGNLYSRPGTVAMVTQVQCKFYDWQAGGDSPIGNSVLLDVQVAE